MRKLFWFLCVLLLGFGMLGVANATLYDRGGGLIYDDFLDITWLQDANYGAGSAYDDGLNTTDGRMTRDNAVAWADQLEYQGYNDWRLPTTLEGPDVWGYGYDGTTTRGYNITSSEMGYMYYVNLENLGYYATDGTGPQPDWGLTNTSPFNNLQPSYYWSGTECGSNPDLAYFFLFSTGRQGFGSKATSYYAWAVRPGDSTPVPICSTIFLIGTGLIGLFGFEIFKKK